MVEINSIEDKISKKTRFVNKSRYDTNKQNPEKWIENVDEEYFILQV